MKKDFRMHFGFRRDEEGKREGKRLKMYPFNLEKGTKCEKILR